MKLLLQIALCCSLAAGLGMAQRRGGGGGSHGGGGGGFHGGGGVSHGGMGGGVSRGGMGGGGFRGGGFGGSYGFRGYYGSSYRPYGYSGYWPSYGYWPWYGDYGYSSYPAYSYPVYQPSPNVTVVYPPPAPAAAPATVYVERPNPITREYDQYGQQTNRPTPPTGSDSSIYLIAFRDHSIRAAAAYWTEGGTLHYITLQHEHSQAALNSVDRDLSGQLNRERRVAFTLPASQ